ncbi:hypothetical protein [Moraxella marmotae]|uniref:hypothetical protein n=1 Tax=Moraxella marmotae TaxID=3344520 RepID=UPI0035F3C55A
MSPQDSSQDSNTYTPMADKDRLKVLLFLVGLVLLCCMAFVDFRKFFICLPIGLLTLIGLLMMYKSKNFAAIERTSDLTVGYVLFLSGRFAVGSFFDLDDGDFYIKDTIWAVCLGGLFCILYKQLFEKPLRLHKNWVAKYGIFTKNTPE